MLHVPARKKTGKRACIPAPRYSVKVALVRSLKRRNTLLIYTHIPYICIYMLVYVDSIPLAIHVTSGVM